MQPSVLNAPGIVRVGAFWLKSDGEKIATKITVINNFISIEAGTAVPCRIRVIRGWFPAYQFRTKLTADYMESTEKNPKVALIRRDCLIAFGF